MDFLKCFWIPRRQAWVVAMCALFIVLPIPLLGILIKSISVILFLFFMIAIGCGGWSIHKERQASIQHQRQSVLTQKEIRVEVVLDIIFWIILPFLTEFGKHLVIY